MLDIELIRTNPKLVEENLRRRRNADYMLKFSELMDVDGKLRGAEREGRDLRQKRNEISKRLNETKKAGGNIEEIMKEASKIPEALADIEKRETLLGEQRRALLLRLPNILDESVPFGKDDSENAVVATWGPQKEVAKGLPSHGEFLEEHGLADFERARRNSGAGFYYLIGGVALLDQAVQRLALDLLVAKGFTPVIPPFMLRRAPYEGVTDLADFENVMYKIDGDDLYLIATSEHPMAAVHMGEVIDEDKLPIKMVAVSACFRREIGGHGVDQKGVFRVHQFQKVEQFAFTSPENSKAMHEELRGNGEEFLKRIGISYRVVVNCTGDIGIVAAKKYDIEGWFPRQAKYRELVSCSNCTDYQSRRLGIRMGKLGRPGKIVPHTLNATMVATPRTVAAILENYATADGRIEVPEALRPYMGGVKDISGPAPGF